MLKNPLLDPSPEIAKKLLKYIRTKRDSHLTKSSTEYRYGHRMTTTHYYSKDGNSIALVFRTDKCVDYIRMDIDLPKDLV